MEKVNAAANTQSKQTEGEKKLKPCCACPETKRVRDACIVENGEENCISLIEAHKEFLQFVEMDPKINEGDVEIQEARVFLRERFLKFIAKISNGQNSEIKMVENITVQGKLRAFDLDFENIIVEDLKTPFLPVDKAILRATDIISIRLSNVPKQLLTH